MASPTVLPSQGFLQAFLARECRLDNGKLGNYAPPSINVQAIKLKTNLVMRDPVLLSYSCLGRRPAPKSKNPDEATPVLPLIARDGRYEVEDGLIDKLRRRGFFKTP
jgi:hypothetical protein